jgi:hypothetical protein
MAKTKRKKTERSDESFTVPMKDACGAVGVVPNTILKACAGGYIEGRQYGLGEKRRWWFHPDDIAWLKRQYPKQRKPTAVASV